MDTAARSISPEEEEAIITFFDKLGENIPSEWKPQVVKWARLQLPNGQIARSAWKKNLKPLRSMHMAWMVKVMW